MKAKSIVLALSVLGIAACGALASDQAKGAKETKAPPAPKAKTAQTEAVQQEKQVAMTGSYIKQDVRRSGQITDGASQVLVLDNNAIQQSGASDLKQLLIRRGIH